LSVKADVARLRSFVATQFVNAPRAGAAGGLALARQFHFRVELYSPCYVGNSTQKIRLATGFRVLKLLA
jgi:hypothetical protein